MCARDAKEVIRDVLARTDMVYTVYASRKRYTWNSPLVKHWHTCMLESGTVALQQRNYLNYYQGNNPLVDVYNNHILQEIFYQLSLTIFGSDYHGKNAWMYVKSLIRNMKCTIEHGIGSYVIRFRQLQTYAPHVPSKALALMGRTLEALHEMDCREILREALPGPYSN